MSDNRISFKVKAGTDAPIQFTVSDSLTVAELKQQLAAEDKVNVPAERQRLIYSGRVMKNDDTLSVYKIKDGNTIHLVKSAASNTVQPVGTRSVPAAVPPMAAGSVNDPLTNLTGARYAGLTSLPSASMFGADGGMGAPPSSDDLARMLDDPAVQQTLNAALDNPAFIDQMIRMNPTLASIPGVREMFQSPMMRQFLTNPQLMRMTAEMSHNTSGMDSSFPAPGPTTTSESGTDNNNSASTGANTTSPSSPLLAGIYHGMFGMPPPDGVSANASQNPFLALFNNADAPAATPATTTTGATPSTNTTTSGSNSTPNITTPNPLNPFGLNLNPAALQEAYNLMASGQLGNLFPGMPSGVGAAAAAPPNNRPPEEYYEQQLRQLNDMGFFDFDQNVAALRRSGGSVQGAIEHLLGSM